MAGSGIRGQFEEKFKALIRGIEDKVYVSLRIGARYLGACRGRWCDLHYRRSLYVIFICLLFVHANIMDTCRYAPQLGQD